LIGVIIQARMNSKRLPGKILKKIGNKTLLEHIFYRLSFLKTPVKIVVATSVNPENDIVQDFCKKNNIDCFRGSEENVLERYYLCANKYNFEHIVRLTADNPFVDIEELDNLLELYLKEKPDYAHSFDSLPKGSGAEIFSFQTLKKSYLEGKDSHHLEHVNEYILDNPDMFRISKLQTIKDKNRADISLTVDTEDDYQKACMIINNIKNTYNNILETISFLDSPSEKVK